MTPRPATFWRALSLRGWWLLRRAGGVAPSHAEIPAKARICFKHRIRKKPDTHSRGISLPPLWARGLLVPHHRTVAMPAKADIQVRRISRPTQLCRSRMDQGYLMRRRCLARVVPQFRGRRRKGRRPPSGVSVTVALMPAGASPTYSGVKRRRSCVSASVFSTSDSAPPMHDRLPAPNGR